MVLTSKSQQLHHPYQRPPMFVTRDIYQHPRPIAPAPSKPAAKTLYAGTTLDSDNPSVVRRNARERNRVKQVNNGFVHLRQHIPAAIVADLSNGRRGIGPGAHKKLSKVDTLRMALEYIRRLQTVIKEVDSGSDASSVSSYGSCNSSVSSSPPPSLNGSGFYQSQQYYALSYAGSFQQQQQQLQQSSSMQISPATSTCSAYSSGGAYYAEPAKQFGNDAASAAPLKCEQNYDEYNNTSADDDDILDYITLWQEDM